MWEIFMILPVMARGILIFFVFFLMVSIPMSLAQSRWEDRKEEELQFAEWLYINKPLLEGKPEWEKYKKEYKELMAKNKEIAKKDLPPFGAIYDWIVHKTCPYYE